MINSRLAFYRHSMSSTSCILINSTFGLNFNESYTRVEFVMAYNEKAYKFLNSSHGISANVLLLVIVGRFQLQCQTSLTRT